MSPWCAISKVKSVGWKVTTSVAAKSSVLLKVSSVCILGVFFGGYDKNNRVRMMGSGCGGTNTSLPTSLKAVVPLSLLPDE